MDKLICFPLHRGENYGHATIVDAKNHVVCEMLEIGAKWVDIAQAIVDTMNAKHHA